MRFTRTRPLGAALLAACLVPALASVASASWWDGVEEAKEVELEKILKNPEAFLGVPATFTIQFHRMNKIYNPFFTRFVPERYVNLSAWSGGQALWNKEQYLSSHPLFFVEKDTKLAERVVTFAPLARLKVRGVVHSTFMGEAWIQITEVLEESGAVSNQALSDIIAGDRYAADGRHNAAIQVYQRAWARKDLTDAARSALAYRLGRSYFHLDKMTEAQSYLNQAIQLDPKNEAAKELLEHVVAHMAGSPFAEPEEDKSSLESGRERPVEDEDEEADDADGK